MGGIIIGGIVPHPPIIIPQVGGGELKRVQQTVSAMQDFARRLKGAQPEALVIIGPHGPVFRDAVTLLGGESLEGTLANFGVPQVKIKQGCQRGLQGAILEEAGKEGLPVLELGEEDYSRYGLSQGIDHGALVPLYYLQEAGLQVPLVYISIGWLSYRELYGVGKSIQDAAIRTGLGTAVIASGDLSHCLVPGAPAGYDPAGRDFDQKVVELLKNYQVEELLKLDPGLVNKAAECGLRPISMLLGALEGYQVTPEILSYEGPFGVGYLVASFKIGGPAGEEKMDTKKRKESIYVGLARQALDSSLKGGGEPGLTYPLPEEMQKKAGVFVSLKNKGRLRGCIGTIRPTRDNLAQEIIQNALSAGSSDPRFPPVTLEELSQLEISVDILGPPEEVSGPGELDPKRYGVIVEKGDRRGLLLPDLGGIDSVEEQIDIARQKAGIGPRENYKLYRFEVNRYY